MTDFHMPDSWYDPPEPHSCELCENEEEPDERACWERVCEAAEDARIEAEEARREEEEAPNWWGDDYCYNND